MGENTPLLEGKEKKIYEEILTLTPNDFDTAKIIILDIIEENPDAITKSHLLKTLSEQTKIKKQDINKYFTEEHHKATTYQRTTANKPFGIFADKRELATRFHEEQPYFYDRKRIWWFWNQEEHYYEITDETDLLNELTKYSANNTINSKEKSEIIESLRQIGRTKIPLTPPRNWIQFRNKYIDIIKTPLNNPEEHTHKVTPEYFFTNPIPWKIGKTSDTPVMDRLFTEWVGEKNKESLYELIAYCCYPSYPIQLLFSLWGNGRNGKTQYMKILDYFIGADNTTSTELDILLNNRFETFKLYKKLVCTIGETNFGILSNTSLIKKLTGGDKIGFEKKNKDPFDDYNYAKMIIASNSLPSTEDTSDGFFRRWLIIDFPNEFEDVGDEVWESVPDEEYEALAKKITKILPELLAKGVFVGQGTIPERKQKYISVSNPLSLFIKERCKVSEDSMILSNQLYTEYIGYLSKHKRRRVKPKEFKVALEDEGYYVERSNRKIGIDDQGYSIYKSGYFVMGLELCDDCDICDTKPIQDTLHELRIEKHSKLTQSSQFNAIKEYIDIHKKDNKILIIDKFGIEIILLLLERGDLFELPKGTFRYK